MDLFLSVFLDKIITGNNENNGSYFVETLYNSRCTAYNGTALDNRGHTISCPQLFIENCLVFYVLLILTLLVLHIILWTHSAVWVELKVDPNKYRE